MTTIQEIFKQFCKERHAEDKGRNFDLLQEIYASTEFFDTSLYEIVGIPFTLSKQGKDYVTSFSIENFSLPFQNNFVRIGEQSYIFIREYAPNIITGTVYTIIGKEGNINIPFTIRLEGNTATLLSDLNIPELYNATNLMSQTFHLVIGLCMTLNDMSKKSVVVDKPVNNFYEYYRRKRKPTLKVPQKPIYYVLGEKNKDVSVKYSYIQPTGTLEYSYAFKVRGHWRRIGDKTFGKDRNGLYNIKGYTWVVEHIRGEGELAKRLHVIK